MLEASQVNRLVSVLNLGQAVYERFDAQSKSLGGMTLAQAALLGAFQAHESALTISELARRLLKASHTVTGLVDALEASGHVTRQRDSIDRRKVGVSLTPAGRRRQAAYSQATGQGLSGVAGREDAFMATLSEAEDVFMRLLRPPR